ncbi:MAG: GntR family transcriptional regulator [Angelakisella sp.]|nr:GntR family transcriptional regulator [Angelakisella sp.]
MSSERSLKESIYDKILEGILNYEYKPNQILTEKDLVQRYGCSKSPVREALISLCNDGVLRNIPRCGYEVIRLTMDDVNEIQNFRRVLECGILRQCYKRITPKQLERLRELNRCCTDSRDMFQHWEHITAFHLQLMMCSQNQYAYLQLQRAMAVMRRAYAQFYWDKWDATSPPLDTQNHQKILDALENGDIDLAVTALDNDLNDFGEVQAH